MRDRQTCSDCGILSPETETNYTLISAQFGWRLTRGRDANGDVVVEWRCADCWRNHKKKTQGDEATASPGSTEKAERARGGGPIPKASPSGATLRSSRPPRGASKPPSAASPTRKRS